MPNILIVDDDRTMLHSLRDGLRHFNYAFQVHTAEDGEAALNFLKKQPVDLVITDLIMPVMNGFELLNELSKYYPALPVIVMTGLGGNQTELNLKKYGKLQYLEKPLDLVQLVDKIFNGLSNSTCGGFRVVFLPSFLKLIELEKKSCSLSVRSQEKNGCLFFFKGELIDAEYEDWEKTDAALEIIRWKETEVCIDFQNTRSEKKFDAELDEILYRVFHDEENSQSPPKAKSRKKSEDDTQKFSREGLAGISRSRKVKSDQKEGSGLNQKNLDETLQKLREDIGDSLLATDVWKAGNAVSLGGIQTQPNTVALFDRITHDLNAILTGGGFSEIGEYYLLKLRDNKLMIVLPLQEYRWGMLIDASKVQLGMVLNVAIPNLIQNFQKAREKGGSA